MFFVRFVYGVSWNVKCSIRIDLWLHVFGWFIYIIINIHSVECFSVVKYSLCLFFVFAILFVIFSIRNLAGPTTKIGTLNCAWIRFRWFFFRFVCVCVCFHLCANCSVIQAMCEWFFVCVCVCEDIEVIRFVRVTLRMFMLRMRMLATNVHCVVLFCMFLVQLSVIVCVFFPNHIEWNGQQTGWVKKTNMATTNKMTIHNITYERTETRHMRNVTNNTLNLCK